MRKQKSVVAILLAVMMIFTFMPAMAFADTTPDGNHEYSWGPGYESFTFDGKTYPVTREVNTNTSGWTGLITATVDLSNVSPTIADEIKTAWGGTTPSVDYYDLTDATPAVRYGAGTGTDRAPVVGTYTQSDFEALCYNINDYKAGTADWIWRATGLKLKVPSYVKDYSAVKDLSKTLAATHTTGSEYAFEGWTIAISEPKGYESGATKEQTFELSTSVTRDTAIASGEHAVYGTVANKTVSVNAELTPDNAKFYLDSEDAANAIELGTTSAVLNTVAYDGAEHTVVMAPMTGFSAKYYVMNTNGTYEETKAITVKDVPVNGKVVKAKVVVTNGLTDSKKKEKTYLFNITVKAATTPAISFNKDVDYEDTVGGVKGGFKAVAGYAPTDFVKIYPSDGVKTQTTISDNTTAKNKAAVEANDAELKNFFNDYYEIKTTTKAAWKDYEFLEMSTKTLKTAERKDLNKKYEQLIANLGLNNPTVSDPSKTYVYIEPAASDFEVVFTNAPTSKVYKGKKTTKAGKLKKDQSFTVTAVANDGKTIAYKLVNANIPKISIDSATGKITVKKGAKGTYKIKVKAYVPGNSVVASETQAITIKIKK